MGIKTRVDIDFSQLPITWEPNTNYRIALEEGFVIEDGGLEQPNPADSSFFEFTSNATGPIILSSTPSSGSSLSNVYSIVLNYDRKIIKNSGNIYLYKVGTPNTLVHTYGITDEDVVIGDNLTSLEINLGTYANVATTQYYLLIDQGVVIDYDNFQNNEITNTSTFNYISPTAPVLVSSTPSDNATDIGNIDITLTFDQYVARGTGNIKIINSSTGATRYTFNAATDSRVIINNTIVTLDTNFILEANTTYYITVDTGALLGSTGIPFAGISGSTTLNFTTSSSTGVSYFDTSGLYTSTKAVTIGYVNEYATGVYNILPTQANLDNTKGIKLYEYTSGVSTLIHTFYHGEPGNGTTYDVSGSKPIYVYVQPYLEQNKTYYLLIDDGAYYDSETNLELPGVSDTNLLRFNTNFAITGLNDESYIGNTSNLLWAYPDNDIRLSILDDTTDYTITFSSNIGIFSDGASTSSTYSITGTRSELISLVPDVKFYPTRDTTSTGTMTLTLKLGSTTLSTHTNTLTSAGSNVLPSTDVVSYSTAGTYSFTPSFEQRYYYTNADILLVGGGGGAAIADNTIYPNITSGYGGGATYTELTNRTLTNQSYTITIGGGGLSGYIPNGSDLGDTGGVTSAFGGTAAGGLGGSLGEGVYGGRGGNSGNGNAGYTPFQRLYLTSTNLVPTVPALNSTVKKFGTHSAYFDGTDDHRKFVPTVDRDLYNFGTGDFTIETWIRKTRTGSSEPIFETRYNNSSTTGMTLYINSSGNVVYQSGGTTIFTSTGTISANTWYHIALTRTSGTLRLYINGVQQVFATHTTNYINSYPIYFGAAWLSSSLSYFQGYMDETRVSNISRYSSTSFTPSTTEFVNDEDTVLLCHYNGNYNDDSLDPVQPGLGGGAGGAATSTIPGPGYFSSIYNGYVGIGGGGEPGSPGGGGTSDGYDGLVYIKFKL